MIKRLEPASNDLADKNSALTFLKDKGFYGVVVTPDNQRFRFDLGELIQRLSEDDYAGIREYALENYNHGKDLYEKALAAEPKEGEFQEYFAKSRTDFLENHQDSHESGQSSAKFYLCYEIGKKALEELKVFIYSAESKEEWHEFASALIPAKDEEKRLFEEKLRAVQEKAYWKGYDKRRAEEQENVSKNRNKNGSWRKLLGGG